jgi:hypothetical protein
VSKAARREKQEHELRGLEAEFRAILIAGLQERHWGFLEPYGALYRNAKRERLLRLLVLIRALRTDLGYADDFALGSRFEEYGKATGPNDFGEPKRADMFLEELGEE